MKTINFKYFLTACLMVLLSYYTNAQGCSDAGFCTIDSFKPNSEDGIAINQNQFKIGFSFGGADYETSVFGNYIEYNRTLSDKFGIDLKLTSLAQNGNDIAEFGLSDIYLNANYKINDKFKLSAGAKVPLTDGNTMADDISLPMDYQASLGTFDMILGVGFKVDDIQFVAALQQPLSQNSNQFVGEDYPVDSPLREFQTTNQFKRSGDVLLRASYPIAIGDKLKITPSLLPIYHLTNDQYTDALGVEKDIEGSQGLTLNANAYFDYAINEKSALQLNLAMPFVVRDTRPDGLTRSFVANLEYRFKF